MPIEDLVKLHKEIKSIEARLTEITLLLKGGSLCTMSVDEILYVLKQEVAERALRDHGIY